VTEAAASPESRAAHVISQVYYYVAAVGAVGLFLGGSIATLFGIRQLVLPRELDTTHEAVRTILHGLAFVLPGVGIMWWHLRQARRREDRPPVTVFWGRALYFHLIALVALLFAVIGTVGLLFNLADAAVGCEPAQHAFAETHAGESYTDIETIEGQPPESYCYPTRDSALRSATDMSIFLIVAGPVFWWHLRQGRRLTAPPQDPQAA
jgi:hypothetical protein